MTFDRQLSLFPLYDAIPTKSAFPSTRYQGSKRKFVEWIWYNIKDLPFDTALDLFGGTGAVSYALKQQGKQVTYNDYLTFNWMIGLALIQNAHVRLEDHEVEAILAMHPKMDYPDFIERTFKDIYYTDDENRWLDRVVYNINHTLTDPFKGALARFALFQACIIKRPYNLFHRANLYVRQAQVERSFGNKTTWDTPFEVHFRAFVTEANSAVFDNGRENVALNLPASETPTGYDLVYIDPPYLNARGVGVDYRDFYHFLEGIMQYDDWHGLIDPRSKHKRLKPLASSWQDRNAILSAFETVIERHRDSTLVISYRDDGIPSKAQLLELLHGYKPNIREAELPQKYALAKQASHEILLIGT